jgi:alpha-D-ribose 1-methylphosphonate 5-triphosphate synthase subunit PhnG
MDVTNSGPATAAAAPNDNAARRAAMATLADARTDEIAALLTVFGVPTHVELRPVETGLVMLQGRIGGDGAPFNFGEATVTRAAVRIASGETGFAYVLGRDPDKARLAAVCDALWQNADARAPLERDVLTPLRTRLEDARAKRREQTAASRVDFFTLVRGED